MPLFDLSTVLRAVGLGETTDGLRRVEQQARLTSAQLDNLSSLSYSELLVGQKQLEQSIGQVSVAANTSTIAAGRSALAFQSLSRSLLFVGSSGNFAGRGMAGVIANLAGLATSFSPAGRIMAGISIVGLAVNALWDRWEKGANKAAEATAKATEEFRRLVAQGSFAEQNTRLVKLNEQLDDLHDKLAKLKAEQASQSGAAAASGVGVVTPSTGGQAELERQIELVEDQISKLQFGISMRAQADERHIEMQELEKRMSEERGVIEQRQSELQEAEDEGHMKAASIARGALAAARVELENLRRAFLSLKPTPDQLKAMQFADADVVRRGGESATTRQVQQANKSESKRPSRDKPDLDAIEAEITALENERRTLEQTGQAWTVANAAVLKFASIEMRLNTLLASGTLDVDAYKRALEDLESAEEGASKAGDSLNAKFMARSLPEAKTALQERLEEIQQGAAAAFERFGQQMGSLWGNLWSNLARSSSSKRAFANLGKGLQSAFGQLLVDFGSVLVPFGKLMIAFQAAVQASPLLAGPVGVAIGLAMIALGSSLGAAANAAYSGDMPPSFQSYLGPLSTLTTLYSGRPGSTNPVNGLPEPSGPQAPIFVSGNNILGTNDTALAKAIVQLINNGATVGARLNSNTVKS